MQLENIALFMKDHLEMETFFRKLEHMVSSFPKMNCKYKILPKIAEATQFGSGGTAALTTILKLAEQLNTEEYQVCPPPPPPAPGQRHRQRPVSGTADPRSSQTG